MEKIQQSSDEKFNKIFTILYSVNQDLKLFSNFDVDRILECRIISVSEEARGRGLAKELMKRSIQIARNNNFKVISAYLLSIQKQYTMKMINLINLNYLQHL